MKNIQYIASTQEDFKKLEERVNKFSNEYYLETTGGLYAKRHSWPQTVKIYPAGRYQRIEDVERVAGREASGKLLSANPDEISLEIDDVTYFVQYVSDEELLIREIKKEMRNIT